MPMPSSGYMAQMTAQEEQAQEDKVALEAMKCLIGKTDWLYPGKYDRDVAVIAELSYKIAREMRKQRLKPAAEST